MHAITLFIGTLLLSFVLLHGSENKIISKFGNLKISKLADQPDHRTGSEINKGKPTMKKIIFTKNAPSPIGPYSQAVEAGGFLYASGQIAIDPATGNMAQGIENETHRVMQNIEAILKEAGLDWTKVVKTTIFLKDLNDFGKVNEIYGSFFKSDYPARET